MHEWIDDEIPTDQNRERRKDIRRAVLGGIAGVTMLVGPIVLANAVVPDDDGDADVEAEDESATSVVHALRNQESASQADLARASGAQSIRTTTTTTTAPPTTTTTTEPPTTTTTTTEPPPPAEVDPPPDTGAPAPDPYSYATWDQLAECESGGNWSINTGNGYYGGLQFSLSSWQGVGGTGYPHEASRETQIAMGIRLYESSGWGAWPACTRELGWR